MTAREVWRHRHTLACGAASVIVPAMRPLVLAGLLLPLAAEAQDAAPTQDELLAAKLASPFLQQAAWFTDWDAALAAAAKRQQLVFAYFTTVNH